MSDFKVVSLLNPGGVVFNSGIIAASLSGNTAGALAAISSGTLYLAGGNNITLSQNGQSVTISGANTFAPGLTNVNISAGTTSQNLSNLVLSNSNNVSFGLNGSTITATVTVASTQGSVNFSAGTTSNLRSNIIFSNSNGLTFGLDNGTITGSYTVPTVPAQGSFGLSTIGNTLGNTGVVTGQLVLAGGNNVTLSGSTNGGSITVTISAAAGGGAVGSISAGTTRATLGEAVFSNSNGISFGANGQTITGSHNGLTNINVSAGTTSNNLSAIIFSNSNGISFGINASTLTASHNALTSQSNQAVSAPNGSFAFQTFQFFNSNGISASTTTGSGIIFSHNGITSQTNQNISVFATGNTTQSSSATINASSFIIRGSGIVSVGASNGSLIIDAPSGGGGGITNINISAGTTSNNLSNLVFSNSNGVSFGLNGSTITGSVNAGGGTTLSGWMPQKNQEWITLGFLNASLALNPEVLPTAVQFDRILIPIQFTGATNSTGRYTLSVFPALYTRNNSTFSLLHSTSFTTAWTHSGTANSVSNVNIRYISIPWTTTIAPNNYLVGLLMRSTSNSANATINRIVGSQLASVISGYLGAATNSNFGNYPFMGVYNSSTTVLPSSFELSRVINNSTVGNRPYIMHFTSGDLS